MLTADLVDARRKDGELRLRPLDAAGRIEALAIAATLLETAHSLVGRRRGELDEAWEATTAGAPPKRVKLAAGLRKLALDACTFEAETLHDPVLLRRTLFTQASEARRKLHDGERFDRSAMLDGAARALGIQPDELARAIFSDLKSEHLLRAAPTLDAESLVEAWELGQAQAVMLVAVRITLEIGAASAGLARAFFAKLKFHKLLFSVERSKEGWRVVVDGPYSMFDSVTKYGLRLAFVLPALRALERWSLVADVRWGKAREPLVFRLSSEEMPVDGPKGGRREDTLHLSDDVRELALAVDALATEWRARPTTVLLDVPGHGICIPDLELTREGERVYLEVLGYWSRDAVFRRVELAERGLGAPVIFAVSSRLRVSEQVLDESTASSLYVYKGKMSPRSVIERAQRAVGRRAPR